MFGGRVVTVPARNYGHDLKAMLAAITPKTRVVFVANPNNPTGTVVSPAELREFVNAVPDHVLVAVDEAYIEFLEDPLDLTVPIREGRNPNLILMRTFSKIYGLAGLRIGYGIGHPEVLTMLDKVRQPFNINSVVQAGALAALDDDDHIQATRHTNREGLDYYMAEFKAMGVEYVPSSGNFILLRVGDGHRVFHDMQKQGVITRPMGGYQLPEWIRISVGTAQENARCVGALRKVLEAHKKT
jgi:histidinol-phosphate aminotransferase